MKLCSFEKVIKLIELMLAIFGQSTRKWAIRDQIKSSCSTPVFSHRKIWDTISYALFVKYQTIHNRSTGTILDVGIASRHGENFELWFQDRNISFCLKGFTDSPKVKLKHVMKGQICAQFHVYTLCLLFAALPVVFKYSFLFLG